MLKFPAGKHWLAVEEGKGLTCAALGKAQEAKPVMSTATASPETIFSEGDMFMCFLRSAHRCRKERARGAGSLRA
jgi:hypothetical protein